MAAETSIGLSKETKVRLREFWKANENYPGEVESYNQLLNEMLDYITELQQN